MGNLIILTRGYQQSWIGLWIKSIIWQKTKQYQCIVAEGVGFEPTRGLHPWRFSSPLRHFPDVSQTCRNTPLLFGLTCPFLPFLPGILPVISYLFRSVLYPRVPSRCPQIDSRTGFSGHRRLIRTKLGACARR